jgi:hemerythrin superfamily protein
MSSKSVSKSSASQQSQRKAAASQPDALEFLKSQHREVEDLFKQFEKLGDEGPSEEKEPIVRMACEKLTVHASIEEEIFYPAAREIDDVESLLNEAEVEHNTAKDLIATLDSMDASDPMFSATFTVLSEYIKHHVKEEEGELFPKVKKSDLDLDALGQELAAQADELMSAQEAS